MTARPEKTVPQDDGSMVISKVDRAITWAAVTMLKLHIKAEMAEKKPGEKLPSHFNQEFLGLLSDLTGRLAPTLGLKSKDETAS